MKKVLTYSQSFHTTDNNELVNWKWLWHRKKEKPMYQEDNQFKRIVSYI